jgi:hypothetical protein
VKSLASIEEGSCIPKACQTTPPAMQLLDHRHVHSTTCPPDSDAQPQTLPISHTQSMVLNDYDMHRENVQVQKTSSASCESAASFRDPLIILYYFRVTSLYRDFCLQLMEESSTGEEKSRGQRGNGATVHGNRSSKISKNALS